MGEGEREREIERVERERKRKRGRLHYTRIDVQAWSNERERGGEANRQAGKPKAVDYLHS